MLLVLLVSACSGGESSGGQVDYEQTKKMVVDILKTDDGKKAIQEVMSDDEMKQQLVMNESLVTDTISTTLTSDKGTEFWTKSFEDPKFAEAMGKSMQKENEELLKGLMKDPEYQGMFMDILKDPEMQKEISEALKSKEYREHLQTVILETFDSPLFKAKIQELLLKAAEEMGAGTEQQGGGEESGGGGSESGGEAGGGSESEGGSEGESA
ncbi:spore gernimation protein GerD [Bacillus coahuilensis p1.1.43]|uniref:Spore gernimation protein GerD n=1 Tax=Bacillus coahuilensis p1.1.43 TaxID=1150625 RepID=A0A147K5A3_9BACI|nr:spore germination lipoprotein GerD [Bacillus coahuilensis]KUP04753.1 spore gernimation protein GerD [Bacillus coahuilensis p1.1.43]